MRRARTEIGRLVCWSVLIAIASICWFVAIPATRRTNDPVGEGLVIHFLIRWGPPIAAGWLGLQQLLARRQRLRSQRL